MAATNLCRRRGNPQPPPSSVVLMEGLPDELALFILARLPCALQAQMRLVSRAWNAALSGAITPLRSTEAWPLLQSSDKRWFFVDPLLRRLHPIPTPLPPSRCRDMFPAGSERSILAISQGGIPHHGMYWLEVLRMRWHHAPTPTVQQYYVEGNETTGNDFASAILDGYLYVSGGGDGEGSINSAERWRVGGDNTSFSWERLPDMHHKRIWARGLVFQGCFCVVGGYEVSSGYEELAPIYSGEMWDPKSRQWTLVPHLWPSNVFGVEPGEPELAVVMGRLYALKHYAREILYYKDATQQWISISCMPTDPAERFYGQCKLLGVGCELWLVVYTWDGRDRLRPRPDVKVFTAVATSVSQPLLWELSQFTFDAGSNFLGTVIYV